MSKQIIIPRDGVEVWHPLKERFVISDGESVVWSQYWANRLRDGDITLGKGPIADSINAQKKAKIEREKKLIAQQKSDSKKNGGEK